MPSERYPWLASHVLRAAALLKRSRSSTSIGWSAVSSKLSTEHEQRIRMTRQEVIDEHRQNEGDPKVRQRQRARAREMARRGLAKAVRGADFVIVNPTHVSVALRYRLAEGAPVLTAKGYDEVALYIRKIAKEHKIPIVENVQLARTLAKRVKVGRAIPVDLYAAVAQVLAFVYRLKNKALQTSQPQNRPR